MSFTHNIQDCFSRAIIENKAEIITHEIIPNGIRADERYNIYRNNTFITLGQALAQNFPVVCRLVGITFFDQMAREYIQKHPPISPLLMTYGGTLANFIDGFMPAAGLPYLADVARLENAWNESFNGLDASGFDIALLKEVPHDQFNDLKFWFLPNMSLMTSEYPILSIWLANQDNSTLTKEISLDDGGSNISVYRAGQDVEIMNFNKDGLYFLEKLYSGVVLGDATEETMAKYPDFILQEFMQHILQSGMIDGFEIT